MHSTKLIFFDLDGTLIDSLPDLAWAVDRMMLSMNKTPPGILNTKSWVGNGAAKLIKRALTHSMDAEPEAKEFHHAQQLFNRFYSETLSVRSRLYEGVMVTLEQLKRHAIGFVCITNKPSEFTLPLLQQLCLTPFFDLVICGDSLNYKKPHPEPLFYAAEQSQIAISDCLMVGDSKNDIEAARAAGCPVVAVSYGYNHGEDIRLANPDACIDHFADLLPLIVPAA
ncbi:MAG: phosphoglycolate phosphatase [Pseudomonadales bacterium]|nr:phosphoglycolate phosphatase [Pseudomonadales bacterium]MCP5214858.1 phosphoglycolate phosphatase [Pseudomonadales bacterium]